MEDVTAKMAHILGMFIACDDFREKADGLAGLEGLPAEPHRSEDMQKAMELLADLMAGRIRCHRKETAAP